MEITYTNHEGFYLPNLTLPRKEEASFGRYGRLRLKYLKEHRRVLYINLLTSGELAQHLNEVDQQAREMLELLVKQMAQEQGITEQLRVEDQITLFLTSMLSLPLLLPSFNLPRRLQWELPLYHDIFISCQHSSASSGSGAARRGLLYSFLGR